MEILVNSTWASKVSTCGSLPFAESAALSHLAASPGAEAQAATKLLPSGFPI